EQTPKIVDNKLTLYVRNEAEITLLQKKLSDKLANILQACGFPNFEIQFVASELAEIQQRLEKQQAQENAAKMKQALLQSESFGAAANGPHMIGSKIDEDPVPIETIQDEERK